MFLPGTEYLITSLDGTFVKNFFQDTTTTCPAGERGSSAYPADVVCGPLPPASSPGKETGNE